MSLPIQIRATFRESWPDGIRQLAIPAVSLQLSQEDVLYLGQRQPLFREAFGISTSRIDCPELPKRIEGVLSQIRCPVFPRIGYCSWKRGVPCIPPCHNAREILSIILSADERVARGLIAGVSCGDPVWLHLVEWRDMSRATEIRVFIHDGLMIGATAYNEDPQTPIDLGTGLALRARLREFLHLLLPTLHLRSLVVDLRLDRGTGDSRTELIEINPFSIMTGSGHFEWISYKSFNQTLRFAGVQLDL